MAQNDQHRMILVGKDEHSEEWFCPTCGRRFLMSWPPEFKRTILEPGDPLAIHTGSKTPFGMFLDVKQFLMVNGEQEPLPPEFEEWERNHQ